MLDYKVGQHIAVKQEKYPTIIHVHKQKFFPNGNMDKLKARLVADETQQGRQLYDFISSAIVSLQVIFLSFNAASYHRCMVSTVDI